ncbi:hypothetical protein CYMTET_12479 [Cymbomonas tetramitiformis]|uniref:Uncharacterized protein n=1 Tax=Cymbomonas tetramitiformis TaxID=36881 RepID=A0AAE0LBT2_9CHLO|nr:hypothetical protein CYMTET_12479 [Cymbomonas tetramitiformis]
MRNGEMKMADNQLYSCRLMRLSAAAAAAAAYLPISGPNQITLVRPLLKWEAAADAAGAINSVAWWHPNRSRGSKDATLVLRPRDVDGRHEVGKLGDDHGRQISCNRKYLIRTAA